MGKVNTNQPKKKEVCGSSGGKKRKSGALLQGKDVNGKRLKTCAKKLEWNEEEEIRVLQGMIEFRALTGKNPFDDPKKTYEFIRDCTIYEPYSYEYVEKMMSLKKKLMDQKKKVKKQASLGRHDEKSSQLLKLIWGEDVEPAVEKPKRIVKTEEEKKEMVHEGGKWFENAFMVRHIVSLGVDEDSLKRKWGSVPAAKKNKIDQKWTVLHAKELESMSEKAKFLNEVVSMIVQASSSL